MTPNAHRHGKASSDALTFETKIAEATRSWHLFSNSSDARPQDAAMVVWALQGSAQPTRRSNSCSLTREGKSGVLQDKRVNRNPQWYTSHTPQTSRASLSLNQIRRPPWGSKVCFASLQPSRTSPGCPQYREAGPDVVSGAEFRIVPRARLFWTFRGQRCVQTANLNFVW